MTAGATARRLRPWRLGLVWDRIGNGLILGIVVNLVLVAAGAVSDPEFELVGSAMLAYAFTTGVAQELVRSGVARRDLPRRPQALELLLTGLVAAPWIVAAWTGLSTLPFTAGAAVVLAFAVPPAVSAAWIAANQRPVDIEVFELESVRHLLAVLAAFVVGIVAAWALAVYRYDASADDRRWLVGGAILVGGWTLWGPVRDLLRRSRTSSPLD